MIHNKNIDAINNRKKYLFRMVGIMFIVAILLVFNQELISSNIINIVQKEMNIYLEHYFSTQHNSFALYLESVLNEAEKAFIFLASTIKILVSSVIEGNQSL